MEPQKPWREITEYFYDKKRMSQEDIDNNEELRIYACIQEYFDKNVSKRAVDESLFGDGIGGVRVSSVRSTGSSETSAKGQLTIVATVILPSGNEGTIRHTFDRAESKVSFDYIKPKEKTEKFPRGFGRELFKQYIPALRELGFKRIEIQASSVPSSGMNGAYTWCFYGFTNSTMKNTMQKYILYLEDYHGIFLDEKRRNSIMELSRMKRFLGEQHAEDFLKAKKRGTMQWSGYIPDISNENTIEMKELINYLLGEK